MDHKKELGAGSMRIHASIFLMAALFAFISPVRAAEPANEAPSRTVGRVFGKIVTAADIGLTAPIDSKVKFDARDDARWSLMERINGAFGGPVLERFVKDRKIKATDEEIDKFKSVSRKSQERTVRRWEERLVELRKKLAVPNLSDTEKAELTEEQSRLTRLLAAYRTPPEADGGDEIARTFIEAWKTERELHRVYGGRVIFQQSGAEALDARRRLFEGAEKKGDIKFDDPGVRHLFYYYSHMEHTAIDEKALEKPSFLDDGAQPRAEDSKWYPGNVS